MRVRIGFWLWGLRCALKPRWTHRGLTDVEEEK